MSRFYPETLAMLHASPAAARVDPEQIHIDKIFPTPIASLVLPGHAQLNAHLAEIILARAGSYPGTQHSNQGGWQSQDDFAAWAGAPGATLLAFARSFVNELTAISTPDLGLVEATLDWQSSAWANINRSGHSNALHSHPGAFWSGVYWVDDGGESGLEAGGELEFSDPRGVLPIMVNPELRMRIAGCLTAGYRTSVKPSSGTLTLFPSWLMHAVRRFDGLRPRISVAFNFAAPRVYASAG